MFLRYFYRYINTISTSLGIMTHRSPIYQSSKIVINVPAAS